MLANHPAMLVRRDSPTSAVLAGTARGQRRENLNVIDINVKARERVIIIKKE